MKARRMVHVGGVDAPVTLADVKSIAAEVWRAVGKGKDSPKTAGVDVLGWEFAFELNELARQVAAEARVDVSFKKIPREVLEKRAVEQGDIRFFELAALAVDVKVKKREVILELTDFVISPDDVPEEVRRSIKHWASTLTTGQWTGTTMVTASTTNGRRTAPERAQGWKPRPLGHTTDRGSTRFW